MHTPLIRTFAPEEWKTYRNLRLRALADSPDAFGRTLAEEQSHRDAWWANRLSSGADPGWDLPLVAEVDEEPVGLAWGRIDRDDRKLAHLFQMWVAPSHRRLGAGRMLLESVIAWARAQNACSLELDVTIRDSPAMRLYTRAGFEAVGEPQPLRPGSEWSEQLMRLKLRDGDD